MVVLGRMRVFVGFGFLFVNWGIWDGWVVGFLLVFSLVERNCFWLRVRARRNRGSIFLRIR